MSATTPIEWADSSSNPVMGCDGCELWLPGPGRTPPPAGARHCYAGQSHQVRAGNPGYAENFLVPKLFAGRTAAMAGLKDLRGTDRADKQWMNGLPRLIFVSDMGDALSKDIPFAFLRQEIVDVADSAKGRRHEWLWLTKQPSRMVDFSCWLRDQGAAWPANLWAMTSITSQKTIGRVSWLLKVVGPVVRALSIEPLLGPVDLSPFLPTLVPAGIDATNQAGIGWAIVGGESGPGARPCHVEWVRSAIRQLRGAEVPIFVKQLGFNPHVPAPGHGTQLLRLKDRKGGDWSEWPEEFRIREFPRRVSWMRAAA